MKVIALSGSLRAASVNSTLLRATARLAPSDMNLIVFEGIGVLTLFNPDLESNPPRGVSEFQDAVSQSDALIIASPEYAHGMSGVMKNALDWLVGLEAFVSKPVAIYNASPRAHHADAALRETLRTMAALIVEPSCLTLPLIGAQLDEDGIAAILDFATPIRDSLKALSQAVVNFRSDALTSQHQVQRRT